ncbi:MAG: CusA/CzcA family heavy metal efflux RND transporter [Bacteriovoracaceae bacterium]|nr:CusA/CzcA family heavy metal efflux RND transporter [Bacteriovoracaceae bacterium]
MKYFFKTILNQKIWILAFFALVTSIFLITLKDIKLAAFPDITNVQVVVNTKTGAFSTEQIEKIVTYPIEMEVSGLPGVQEIRSLSKFGLSQVTIIFEEGVNPYFARQVVSEKLQSASGNLPQGVNPELSPMTTGLGEVFMYVLTYEGDKNFKSEIEKLQYLKVIQEYQIRPILKKVKGVAEVDTNGGFNSEIHINYLPKKLNEFGVSVMDLVEAVEKAGVFHGGGYIQKGENQVTVRSFTPLNEPNDLKNFLIKILPNGRRIYVKDVADVRVDFGLRVGSATYNGEETVLGTVLMRVGENSREVANESARALEKINFPTGVKLTPVYNRTFLVDETIKTIRNNLFEGAILVIVVLFLVLGHIKSAILVSLSIPFSMIFALLGMNINDIPVNLMSLGAIDFGLLVDGPVVLVENYLRRVSLENESNSKLEGKRRIELIIDSCAEVAPPVIYGLLIIMLVYIPILGLSGVEGKMFEPMALTVLMALGASLLVALFVVPILIYYFIFPLVGIHEEPIFFRILHKGYIFALPKVLAFKIPVILFALTLSGIGLFLFLNLGSDFAPQLDERDLVIGLVRDSRQSIEVSTKRQVEAEKIIKKVPEVDLVFSRLGTPESATDPMGPNFADTFVILKKDQSEWRKVAGKTISKEQVFNEIKVELEKGQPQQDISATQPIEMRFNEILEGSRADVTFRVLGPDLEKLVEYAEIAHNTLKEIDGVESVEFDALTGLTKSEVLDIQVDQKKASETGIPVHLIDEQLETALAGKELGYLLKGDQKLPVILHLDESLRNSIDQMKKIPLTHPEGGSLPADEVADFKLTEKVTTIARSFGRRYSAVSVYLAGRDVASFVEEAKKKIEGALSLEPGYEIEWGGQFKNLERAQKTLSLIIPITLLFIFLLIYKMTNSVVQTLIIFSVIPAGGAGGAILLFLRDINFSVSAAVGFIALSGIVVLNSLVLVSFVNQKIEEGQVIDHAILSGSIARLRPVGMTALVAALGFIPMAFNTGLGAEVQRPLATVVIGGLMTATPATLFLTPSLLAMFLKRIRA